jgi:hypothetical protein
MDVQNRIAPGYAVLLLPPDSQEWTFRSTRAPATTRAGSDGTYRFEGLAAGTYLLAAAMEIDQTRLTDANYLSQFVPTAVKITIEPGEKKAQDLRIGG